MSICTQVRLRLNESNITGQHQITDITVPPPKKKDYSVVPVRAAPGYKSSLEYTILPTPTQALPQYAYTMATQALK